MRASRPPATMNAGAARSVDINGRTAGALSVYVPAQSCLALEPLGVGHAQCPRLRRIYEVTARHPAVSADWSTKYGIIKTWRVSAEAYCEAFSIMRDDNILK